MNVLDRIAARRFVQPALPNGPACGGETAADPGAASSKARRPLMATNAVPSLETTFDELAR